MRFLVPLVCAAAISSTTAHATSGEISLTDLKKIQENLQKSDAFSVDFTQTVFRKLRNREVKSAGSAIFGKPNLFRWMLREPNRVELIYNGTELVQFEPDEKLALKL